MKSAKILTVALASVLLLASCGTTSTESTPSGGDSTSVTPTPSTSDSTSPLFTTWTGAFDKVVSEVTSGAETVASIEAEYNFMMTVAQIEANVPYFDAPFDESWTGYVLFDSSYFFGEDDVMWAISCGTFNRFTIEEAATSLDDTLAATLSPLDNWAGETGGDWRTTLSDGTTYSISVGWSNDYELCICFDQYTTPTSWGSYLNRYAYYEQEVEFVLTIEEIEAYVPFIEPSVFEFTEVSPIYANTAGTLMYWTICGDSALSSEAIQADLTAIGNAIAAVCTTEKGWSTTTSGTTTWYYYEASDLLTVYVAATTLTNSQTGEYTPCIIFDGYHAPTAWSEYFDVSEESSGDYNFVLTASLIDQYVPFFNYDFDTYLPVDSSFTAKYGIEYSAWSVAMQTSSSQYALHLAALNSTLATNLTTELGWTREGSGTDIVFYKDIENLGTIYVYAYYTTLYDSLGNAYPYIVLTFDAALDSVTITSWADYIAAYYSYYELRYPFALDAEDINTYIPYWESQYTAGIYSGDSLFTPGYSVWGVGVGNLASAEVQAATVDAIAAELAAALGENTDWTATDVKVSDTYTAKGYSRKVSDTLTIYIYAVPATRTTNSDGETLETPVYGAYLVFDAALTIPAPTAWGDIPNDLGFTTDYFVYYFETYYGAITSGTFAAFEKYVPYVDYDWDGLAVTSLTSSFYAYVVYVTSTAEEYATELAAVTAAVSEKLLAAGFTYNEEYDEYFIAVSSTLGLYVSVGGSETTAEIYLVFYLYTLS